MITIHYNDEYTYDIITRIFLYFPLHDSFNCLKSATITCVGQRIERVLFLVYRYLHIESCLFMEIF